MRLVIKCKFLSTARMNKNRTSIFCTFQVLIIQEKKGHIFCFRDQKINLSFLSYFNRIILTFVFVLQLSDDWVEFTEPFRFIISTLKNWGYLCGTFWMHPNHKQRYEFVFLLTIIKNGLEAKKNLPDCVGHAMIYKQIHLIFSHWTERITIWIKIIRSVNALLESIKIG